MGYFASDSIRSDRDLFFYLTIKFWKIGAGAEQQKHTELLQALEQKLREADKKVKQTEEKLKTAESEKDTAMQCVK